MISSSALRSWLAGGYPALFSTFSTFCASSGMSRGLAL